MMMENAEKAQESKEIDCYDEQPLSPILSCSSQNSILFKKKRQRKSRVKLANRFSQDNSSRSEDVFAEKDDSNFKKPSSPAPVAKKIKMSQDFETAKCEGFQTAAGKNISVLSSAVKQSKALFSDILNPLYTQESRCNKYSFLTKTKSGGGSLIDPNEVAVSHTNYSLSNERYNKESPSFLNSEETDQLFSIMSMIENKINKQTKHKNGEDFRGFSENSIKTSREIAAEMGNKLNTREKIYQQAYLKYISNKTYINFSDQKGGISSNSLCNITAKREENEILPQFKSFTFASGHGAPAKLLESGENAAQHNASSFRKSITTQIFKGIDLNLTCTDGGFQFASGNPVHLSEETLEKAAGKLLESAENDVKSTTIPTSSKSITQSSFKKAKNIFREIDLNIEEFVSSSNKAKKEKYEITAESGGFQFASGNPVHLSEETLEKAAEKLLECAENDVKSTTIPTSSKSITQSSSKKAKNIFRGIDLNIEEFTFLNNKIKYEKYEITAESGGFQFASGKSARLSEKALEKAAARLLESVESIPLEKKSKDMTKYLSNGTDETPLNSFANSQVIKKQEFAAEETAAKLLENADNVTSSSSASSITQLSNLHLHNSDKIHIKEENNEAATLCAGFQLASGNVVRLTDNALKSAEKLLNNEESVANKVSDIFKGIDLNIDPSSHGFSKIKKENFQIGGFQLASGNTVKVSQNALETAGKLFENEKDTTEDKINLSKNLSAHPNQSLAKSYESSASRNSVLVLEKALRKAADMLLKDESMSQCDDGQLDYKTSESSIATGSLYDVAHSDSLSKIPKMETSREAKYSINGKKSVSSSSGGNNKRKRLGTTPCKPVYIPHKKLEKCKLFFDDDKSTGRSPVKMTESVIFNSTPVKSFMSIPSEPDITPIKNIEESFEEQEKENFENSSVLIQECTKGNIKTWREKLECERFKLEMKLKLIIEREEALKRQSCVLQSRSLDYRRRRTGVLFNNKQIAHKIQLQDFVKLNDSPNRFHYITPQNAECVHFKCAEQNVPYINTADGASVIPNVENIVGLSEIEMAFTTMPGVEPKLIPTGWIRNHFKWIVWKLASYERFASNLQDALTIENVMQQLKYRYDREIDKVERSALRKIFEKDDVSQKRMVLCVSDIFRLAADKYELELTDGWYSVRTVIDQPLCVQVQKQKIRIGTKLVTCGAELLNCDGCYPLEATDMVRLKISYNSTRRAVWYAKLGYQKWLEPFPVTLQSLSPDGGTAGCVKVYIARIYPVKYLEKQNKLSVWRNKKAEEIRAQNWENERLKQIEEIREIARNDCKQTAQNKKLHVDRNMNSSDIKNINCPETLYNLYQNSRDPESLHELLSESQIRGIMEYQQRSSFMQQQEMNRRVEERVSELQLPKRDVTALLQLLVVDVIDLQEKANILQIWKPSEAHGHLKESAVYYVYNVLPKKNGLGSTTRTKFQTVTEEFPKFNKYKRILTPISLLSSLVNKPLLNEFDTVGIVVQIAINNFEQNLWLADVCGSLLFIKVFEGPKNCSLLDKIKSGQLIAVSNLVLRDSKCEFAEAIANHSTVISCYPKHKHLQEGMKQLNETCPQDMSAFLIECNKKVACYVDLVDLDNACNNHSFSSFIQSNTPSSSNVFDESCDEATLIQSRITRTDVALSLIDIDTIASKNQ